MLITCIRCVTTLSRKLPIITLLCSLFLPLLIPTTASADVKGPIIVSSSDPRLGETEAVSWSFNFSRSISSPIGSGGSRESSSPSISEVTIERLTDEFSPAFIEAALTGRQPIARIVLVRDEMTITLEDCMISSYSLDGQAWVDVRNRLRRSRMPQIEKISINFIRVTVKVEENSAGFDIQQNEGV